MSDHRCTQCGTPIEWDGICSTCAGAAHREAEKQRESSKPKPERDHSHLKQHQWQPGQSGNPKGRPPKPSLRQALERSLRKAESKAESGLLLRAVDDEGLPTGPLLRSPTVDELAAEWLKLALNGDRDAMRALTELRDTLDGKPTQRVEHTGADGGDITISASDVRAKLAAFASTADDESAQRDGSAAEAD